MKRLKAYCLVRDRPHYRRDAFLQGLRRLGYDVEYTAPSTVRPDDVLVIWNRYGVHHNLAKRFELVLVAENGFLPMRGTSKSFALALDYHNGAGRYPVRSHDRRDRLDVELLPWRDGPGDVLLLPQRGIGCPGVAMPRTWEHDVRARLARMGRRSVRTRRHPGTDKHATPIERDLDGVGVCVTWASGAGLKAICAGVPVVHEFERWIGAPAARFGLDGDLYRGDRDELLERVAWAQWSVEEVATGEPFARLIEETGK